ncbi:MAG: RAMP superfamily CRISPR-associated protein [Proteobacteria bacterium]|nr:RAMP superfamily CRISPR-associated protein [Pseudomonadota bacterium]
MNPYDFVPLGRPSPRKQPPGHDRLARTGGVIRARLKTLGPFLIAEQDYAVGQGAIRPVKQGAIIPGSSLKGMLRAVAEMVAGGCISASSSLYSHGRYQYRHAKEPTGFAPCDDIDELCITCRMFGALPQGSAWKGLVAPGEGRLCEPDRASIVGPYHIIVGQPKPDHHAFYVERTNNSTDKTIRGRKAYYHHPDQITESTPARKASFGARQTIQVRAVDRGHVYQLSVHHQGLDEAEYALLLYAMFLEPGLAHKLGWGKPHGLGSVAIEPLSVEQTDLLARYRGSARATERCEGAAAAEYIAQLTQGMRDDHSERMAALRRLLAFPGAQSERWSYPSNRWFQDNPAASLEEFNDRHG